MWKIFYLVIITPPPPRKKSILTTAEKKFKSRGHSQRLHNFGFLLVCPIHIYIYDYLGSRAGECSGADPGGAAGRDDRCPPPRLLGLGQIRYLSRIRTQSIWIRFFSNPNIKRVQKAYDIFFSQSFTIWKKGYLKHKPACLDHNCI